MKRVVIDPNVLLSALVGKPDAAPAMLLDAVHDHGLEMVACPMVMAEVRENLEEPYFRALLDRARGRTGRKRHSRAVAVMLPDPVDPEPVLRDGSDDYLLALARSGDAEAIL